MFRAEPARRDGVAHLGRRRGREAAVPVGVPLHRSANRHAAADIEVLAHPDLFSVEEHRRPGQGEHQAVDHPDPARVALEHGRKSAHQSAVVHLHPFLRTERREHLGALLVGELVEGEFVVIADEVRPLDVGRALGAAQEGFRQGTRVAAGKRQVHVLHADEVELHREFVAFAAAEEGVLLLSVEVDFAEQDRLPRTPIEERSQVAKVRVRVRQQLVRHRRCRSCRGGTARHPPGIRTPPTAPRIRSPWRSRRAPARWRC